VRLGDFLTICRKPGVWAPSALLGGLIFLGGCEAAFQKGLLDPSEMMRTSKQRLLVPVLPSLAEGLDEADAEFVNADEVKQADLIPSNADYVVGRNDLLSISITEVAGPGVESVKTTRVSESGNVSLPLIGSIKAAGMTEAELEKAIAQKYRDANLIQNAQVSVTVIEARQRTFSILGAVGRPGQYQIVQSDFRLFDALTLAGDVPVQGIENIYIIRKAPKTGDTTKPTDTGKTPADTTKPNKPIDPLEGKQGRANIESRTQIARAASMNRPLHLTVLDAPTDAVDPSEGGRKVMVDGKWVPARATPPGAKTDTTPATPIPAPGTSTPPPAPDTSAPKVDPLAPKTDTTVVPPLIPDTGTAGTGATAGGNTSGSFEFDAPKPDPDTRILRVPYDRLQRGELQYNVVIRPNDTIIIPSPKVGEYYMGGHVGRAGVYSLTGRNITLKQAVISAGMIDPLGWPERTEVIRRIGKDKEMFVRVNLPKIFAGEQSDFYLRPYDTVNVGTNALAPFLAAIRNSFRFTYGFGFIYDQNFSPDSNANSRNR
jgi:polysaccharide export outer membrane protein